MLKSQHTVALSAQKVLEKSLVSIRVNVLCSFLTNIRRISSVPDQLGSKKLKAAKPFFFGLNSLILDFENLSSSSLLAITLPS